MPPSSDVVLDSEQQAPHLQNTRRKTRLFVSKEGSQDPKMRRHWSQVAGQTEIEKNTGAKLTFVESRWENY